MLGDIAYVFDEDLQNSPDTVGFIQVRLGDPSIRTHSREKHRRILTETNLIFTSCSPEIRAGLHKSRATEWQQWKHSNAGVLLNADVKVNPMQWIETDKNAHKRRDDKTSLRM